MIPGGVIETERSRWQNPSTIGLVAIGGLVLVGLLWFGSGFAPDVGNAAPRPPSSATPPEVVGSATGSSITVHVAGEVARPGLVVVASGSRVADVVLAAGGASGSADLSLLNLAAAVTDGAQVIVPSFGAPAPAGSPTAEGGPGPVQLNLADVDDLMRLPGIGPVIARQIVDYRTRHGPFAVVEDLLDVPGVGEGKLASLRDAVTIP